MVHSFEPIEDRNAQVLILGSMPGRASLAAGQYYAHPQNAFWRILSRLLQCDPASPYPARIKALKSARIALWDVLQSCEREGSLDSMIERETQVANDFQGFFRRHRNVTQVYFNGATAEACFRRQVSGTLDAGPIAYGRLPSTSPANASLSFEQKLRAWRRALGPRAPGEIVPRRLRPVLAQSGNRRSI
jgi:hypoxanthine-DNA glycosylase